MSFLNELKRRNVLRAGAAYVVSAWLVIQVAETIFPLFGFDDTPARVVVIVLAIGFIPAMVFAWVFELTPEGLMKESDIDRSRSITAYTGKKLDRMIMLVLALGLAYFAFDKFLLAPRRQAEELASATQEARREGHSEALVKSYGDKSIAVLPFVNMSDDKSNEYFSDGISEELLNLLAKIPELRVISRSSAFSYKGKDIKLAEVARQLNVAHILEGSVRKSGEQVRITAQLIEARSDTHLWSETYDRKLDDIFAIQDEIAAQVVEQLKLKLLGKAPKVAHTDPAAYTLYLQARHLSRMGTAESLTQAMRLFEQVLGIDPTYADAWAELGRNQINQAGLSLVSDSLGFSQARASLNRALEIDPDHAAALSRLGWIEMAQGDLAAAAGHMQLALQLAPGNTAAIGNAGQLMSALGRHAEAIRLHQMGATMDPANAPSYETLSGALYSGGRMGEAIAAAQTAERLSPGYWGVPNIIGSILLYRHEYESALATFASEGDEKLRVRGTAMAYFSLDHKNEFEAALHELKAGWGDQWPSEVAAVFVWAGNFDVAFEWLDKAAQSRDTLLSSFIHDPLLAPIHEDERWLPFLKSVGMSPAQLDAIEFKVTLPE